VGGVGGVDYAWSHTQEQKSTPGGTNPGPEDHPESKKGHTERKPGDHQTMWAGANAEHKGPAHDAAGSWLKQGDGQVQIGVQCVRKEGGP